MLRRHLDNHDTDVFFDDLTERSRTLWEREADELATEALIPRSLWKSAGLSKRSPAANVMKFAEKLRISPAIVAGRIRFEFNDYTIYKPLIGMRKVRALFGLHGH
jgi:HTH-type transcriptional regulator/antitoxin HigA